MFADMETRMPSQHVPSCACTRHTLMECTLMYIHHIQYTFVCIHTHTEHTFVCTHAHTCPVHSYVHVHTPNTRAIYMCTCMHSTWDIHVPMRHMDTCMCLEHMLMCVHMAHMWSHVCTHMVQIHVPADVRAHLRSEALLHRLVSMHIYLHCVKCKKPSAWDVVFFSCTLSWYLSSK